MGLFGKKRRDTDIVDLLAAFGDVDSAATAVLLTSFFYEGESFGFAEWVAELLGEFKLDPARGDDDLQWQCAASLVTVAVGHSLDAGRTFASPAVVQRVASSFADPGEHWGEPFSDQPGEAAAQLLVRVVPDPGDAGLIILRGVAESGALAIRMEQMADLHFVGAAEGLRRVSPEQRIARAVEVVASLPSEQQAALRRAPATYAQPSSGGIGSILTVKGGSGGRYCVASMRAGGMGTVRMLLPISSGPSAVFAMKTAAGIDQEHFEREARRWAELADHPFVLDVVGYGSGADGAYVLTYWMPSSLADEAGRLRPAKALSLLLDTAEALAESHRRGILHRDVKPANVLINDEGRAQVADFGLAQSVRRPTRLEATGAHGLTDDANWKRTVNFPHAAGTPAYMAPELFNGAHASSASDAYSFGITALEVITGRHPLLEGGQIRSTVPEQIPDAQARVGAEVTSHLIRLAASDRTRRPSLAETVEMLATVLDGMAPGHDDDSDPAQNAPDAGVVAAGLDDDDPALLSLEDAAAVNNVQARAAVLRQQGRTQDAEKLLREAISAYGDDPRLLTALALVITSGQVHAAGAQVPPQFVELTQQAADACIRRRGLVGRGIDVTAIANLFRMELMARHDHAVAYRALGTAARILNERYRENRYPIVDPPLEFGWLAMMDGNWGKGLDEILDDARERAPVSAHLVGWAAVAARVTGREQEVAARLGRIADRVQERSLARTLMLLLAATWVSDESETRRFADATDEAERNELARLAGLLGCEEDWRPPLPQAVIDAILRGVADEAFSREIYGDAIGVINAKR